MLVPDRSSGALVPRTRFLDLKQTANHTSEAQRDEILSSVEDVIESYKCSPLSRLVDDSKYVEDVPDFLTKLSASHKDHAADQQKLNKLLGSIRLDALRQSLGAEFLVTMPEREQDALLNEARGSFVEQAGGWDIVNEMGETEQEARGLEYIHELQE